MNNATLLKFSQFFLIAIVGIVADQWTKWYAEARLASARTGHEIVLTVPPEMDGQGVEAFLATEFTRSSPEEITNITRRWVRDENDRRFGAATKLEAGQKIKVLDRDVVIIEDYFDFEYARNPGAAFSFLADADSSWRMPFFMVTSFIALVIILYILHGVVLRQQLLIWALSLIAGGAVGNFIDRVRFGYVIDFILWKYTDQYRFPTFNVADALICIGVGLMLIEIVRDAMREHAEGEDDEDAIAEVAEES